MGSLRVCDFDGCDRPFSAKGYCASHYAQYRQGRELAPLKPYRVPKIDRFMSKVEKTETCWVWHGTIGRGGYGYFALGRTAVLSHRWVYEYFVERIPTGMFIDHICFNRACVNPDHLRVVTMKQNNEHRKGAQRNNPTGLRGVSYRKESGKYRARVIHGGVVESLGDFATAEEAGEAARLRRLEVFTHSSNDE